MLLNISVRTPMTFLDYPDPEAHAFIIYCMGCNNLCVGCQNPVFGDHDYGKETVRLTQNELHTLCLQLNEKYRTNKVIFSGGDPLFSKNLDFVKLFLKEYKDEFDFCVYTGFEVDYVRKNEVSGFRFIKCGRFEMKNQLISCKTDKYIQFASSNQNLYDSNLNLISTNGRFTFSSRG
jgi:organic radical activating enzyme